MKDEVFYGKGMEKVKSEDEELYQAIVSINDSVVAKTWEATFDRQ